MLVVKKSVLPHQKNLMPHQNYFQQYKQTVHQGQAFGLIKIRLVIAFCAGYQAAECVFVPTSHQ